MSICTVPANQPICDALLAKAASYPPTEPYKAKAYRTAAEYIATTFPFNIYNLYDKQHPSYNRVGIDYIGPSIEEFIHNFIESSKKTSSPPPAWGASVPPYPALPERTPISAPSAIPQTPPKTTTPTNAPPAPKKQQSPKDILRDAMKRMNEEHPEGNIMNILHPMSYGTPYPGYNDEDFDENEPLDEEELTEEEINKIMKRK
jgi:hypothetical protein